MNPPLNLIECNDNDDDDDRNRSQLIIKQILMKTDLGRKKEQT